MDAKVVESPAKRLSLKDAPSLIERLWPTQQISVEAQKERKAVSGQTLTALGSYWKGRKPLVLVRACVLASILPATGDDEADLAIFELLVGMSDEQITDRFKTAPTADEIRTYGTSSQQAALLDEDDAGARLKKLPKTLRVDLMSGVLARMPYQTRVEKLLRPEEVAEEALTGTRMAKVNRHLGTTAKTLAELVEQIGVKRFGHRPRIGDTFCGGGSIPFEAARLGCDVDASDLNPIASMLTWGALNIVGASPERRVAIKRAQAEVADAVDAEIKSLGIEHDERGNRAKAYLYCLEVRCPQTGWHVPILPSFAISKRKNIIASLVPDHARKSFAIKIISGVSAAEVEAAEHGTYRNGNLTYEIDGETYATPIRVIRGDGPESGNALRPWNKSDIEPHADDIFRERLYCIQWITADTVDDHRQETFFAAPTKADLAREAHVETIVRENLSAWQDQGLVPDMAIEPGEKTDEPMRTRGWTYWHHLYKPRHLHIGALIKKHIRSIDDPVIEGALYVFFARALDYMSKLTQWLTRFKKEGSEGGFADAVNHVFYNQALNTFYNYGARSSVGVLDTFCQSVADCEISTTTTVTSAPAKAVASADDIYITDPPYADAISYHEITEYFIAWLRKKPPEPFQDWIWDSRRPLAIRGDGDDFRKNMVDAYAAMSDNMPENGLQIVMFTHQDAGVWADMAQIFWGAGLQVKAAWYIATETTSDLKKGGYVQGTVISPLGSEQSPRQAIRTRSFRK
jgi:putative DNA methylase